MPPRGRPSMDMNPSSSPCRLHPLGSYVLIQQLVRSYITKRGGFSLVIPVAVFCPGTTSAVFSSSASARVYLTGNATTAIIPMNEPSSGLGHSHNGGAKPAERLYGPLIGPSSFRHAFQVPGRWHWKASRVRRPGSREDTTGIRSLA